MARRTVRSKKMRAERSSAPNSCFWQFTGATRYEKLHLWCEEVMTTNMWKAARAYRYACAYDGVTLTSRHSGEAGYDDAVWDGAEVPVIVNTVRRMVNTFVAKSFSADNPCPQMVSNDGTFEQRLAAEAIDEALMAEFELPHGQFASIHELHRHGGTISTCATGQYWVFAFPGEGKVEAELDDGLTIGTIRARQFGQILTLCRTVWQDPEWLKIRYPDAAAEIDKCTETVQANTRYGDARMATPTTRTGSRGTAKRLVKVHQGWRVQVNDDNPGCQTFVLKDGTCLEDEVWDHDEPPGKSWEFERELDGEGGVSLTQTVYRMFMRMNEATHDADRAQRNMPQVAFLCQKGTGESEAVNAQLQGATGVKIIEVSGNVNAAVKAFEMPGLQRAGNELIERYAQNMHDVTGISRAQTSGARQPGTTSGLHESLTASYYTENFADAERRLIQFRAVDCSKLFVWALQKVVEGKYSRWVGDGKKRRELTSQDLDLDDSKYVIQIKPASEEKDSPKARLEKIERLVQDPASKASAGDLIEAWKAFDEKAVAQRIFAAQEWTETQCSKWLRLPEEKLRASFESPSKWMRKDGLETALSVCWKNFVDAREQEAPQTRLRYFEQFADECVELLNQEEQRQADLANTSTRNIFSTNLSPGASSGGPTGAPGPAG
jgi:hypothetical protein